MLSTLSSPKALRAGLLLPLVLALVACGGGDEPAGASQAPDEPASPPVVSGPRWVSSAAQFDLNGGADGGIDGPLLAADPARPQLAVAPTPGRVDSTSVRIYGGKLDATLGTLTDPGPRFVVYDVAAPSGGPYAYSLYKLALDGVGTAAPVPERISAESAICGASGTRFEVLGQSLGGSDALIAYQAPDAGGSCAAGGEPRAVHLAMGRNDAPIALPTAPGQLITPIGVLHGSSGQIAAVLAWQNGGFVRTDANLQNPVPLASSDVAGAVDAASAPLKRGIVTRWGIFVVSADGLRRYDKSTGRMSAPVLKGLVDSGAQVNHFTDDQALYVTTQSPGGTIDLYRVTDTAAPGVTRLNTDGPLHPWGFRVLKSYVLYAVDDPGTNTLTAWRKADGQRSSVLPDKRVVLASSLSDRVFHTSPDAQGGTVLASSLFDGSGERSFGRAQLAAGALAEQTSPQALSVRGNGAFSHAVVVSPQAGASTLAGAAVRWIGFEGAAQDIEAGSLPAALSFGAALQSPGVIGDAGLLAVPLSDGSGAAVFVHRRAAGSLARLSGI